MNALERASAAKRSEALEVGSGLICDALTNHFDRARICAPDSLADLPSAGFEFILAPRAFDGISTPGPVLVCFRESARLLRVGGLFCARLNSLPDSYSRFSMAELGERARDLDFQILAFEGVGSRSVWFLWRKRMTGWRLRISDETLAQEVRITRIANTWDLEPVTPSRGRYAAVTIWVEGLPATLDLLDLEIFTGGIRMNATSISEADAAGLQQIEALLPDLEQTGLLPVELRREGETIAAPSFLRVIPPGPTVPRMVKVSNGSNRGAGITVMIEELARPDELTATINDHPVWGIETVCTDPLAQCYEVRFLIPDQVAAGVHQIHLKAGRRTLPPITIELG